MPLANKYHKKVELKSKIDKFLDEHYLDIQGMSPGLNVFDEATLARLLTKLAVGSATVWWSLLEMKDFLVHYKTNRRRF